MKLTQLISKISTISFKVSGYLDLANSCFKWRLWKLTRVGCSFYLSLFSSARPYMQLNYIQLIIMRSMKTMPQSVDYIRTEGLPNCRVKCLDRVLRTAARLVGRIPRFGRVSGYMRDVLHGSPYPQRIVYRISALVRRCMEGPAPSYFRELCCSTVTFQRRISLRSSAQAELLVPRTRTIIRQRRAFSVAGPTAWNGLPVALRLTPVAHSALFLSSLKTTLFDRGWAGSAGE